MRFEDWGIGNRCEERFEDQGWVQGKVQGSKMKFDVGFGSQG